MIKYYADYRHGKLFAVYKDDGVSVAMMSEGEFMPIPPQCKFIEFARKKSAENPEEYQLKEVGEADLPDLHTEKEINDIAVGKPVVTEEGQHFSAFADVPFKKYEDFDEILYGVVDKITKFDRNQEEDFEMECRGRILGVRRRFFDAGAKILRSPAIAFNGKQIRSMKDIDVATLGKITYDISGMVFRVHPTEVEHYIKGKDRDKWIHAR